MSTVEIIVLSPSSLTPPRKKKMLNHLSLFFRFFFFFPFTVASFLTLISIKTRCTHCTSLEINDVFILAMCLLCDAE